MFLVITEGLQSDFIHIIDIGDLEIREIDEQEEFVESLGYDPVHVDWYFCDNEPTITHFRYDEDDIIPIYK